jgi:hypothetical protein
MKFLIFSVSIGLFFASNLNAFIFDRSWEMIPEEWLQVMYPVTGEAPGRQSCDDITFNKCQVGRIWELLHNRGAIHVKKYSKFFLEMTPLGVKDVGNPNLTFSRRKNASLIQGRPVYLSEKWQKCNFCDFSLQFTHENVKFKFPACFYP